MKLACLSFTALGDKLAEKIQSHVSGEVICYSKETYKPHLDMIFSTCEAVIFISATGIAVRLSAPYLVHKKDDPAIVVIDDMAQNVISLVSGHLGGANELTRTLAKILGANAIITTASDNRGFEAIDLFAKRQALEIEDFDQVKQVTAIMLENKPLVFESRSMPTIHYPNLVQSNGAAAIVVSVKQTIHRDIPFCVLRPKILTIGVGCRRGKPKSDILNAIHSVFNANDICLTCAVEIASIDLKQNEDGLLKVAREMGLNTAFYSAEQLKSVSAQFEQSEFVEETTGVGAVCESAALLSSEKIIVNKTVIDGVTIAVGQKAM